MQERHSIEGIKEFYQIQGREIELSLFMTPNMDKYAQGLKSAGLSEIESHMDLGDNRCQTTSKGCLTGPHSRRAEDSGGELQITRMTEQHIVQKINSWLIVRCGYFH